MNINANISVFRSVTDATPAGSISVGNFCGNVQRCDYSTEIAAIRAEPDKWQRNQLKKQLPCVTISGTFTQRGNQFLIQHSGFIALDFDASDNPTVTDWPTFRDTLGTWSEVLFSALSVSGRGVFCVIPIAYPQNHKQQYLALEADFKTMGIVTDPICKDVARLRILSSDPGAIWNPDAQPYRKVIIEQPKQHSTAKAAPELNKLVQWVERKHGIFTPGNRNNFITQLAGACHRLEIEQREVENYCRQLAQSDFSENSILKTINSIYRNTQWQLTN